METDSSLPFMGLTGGFALNDFTNATLSQCAENCVAHNPTNNLPECVPNVTCYYENPCTGFFYWN